MYWYSLDCECGVLLEVLLSSGDGVYVLLVFSFVGVEFLESYCINGGIFLCIMLKGGVLLFLLGLFEVYWWVDYEY